MKIYLSFDAQPIVISARRVQSDPSSSAYWNLRHRVESLPCEHLTELVALMWLGRGFDGETVGDWPALLEAASVMDADYLCEKAELGSNLDAGREKIVEAVLRSRSRSA